MSEPWGEDVLKARIASLLERAERAEKALRRFELEYGSRMRKAGNRRRELRNAHKAIQRYRALYRELSLRHARQADELRAREAERVRALETLSTVSQGFEAEYARLQARIAELES